MGAHGFRNLAPGADFIKNFPSKYSVLGRIAAGFVPVLGHRYNPLVREEVVERLLTINREFYQSFAEPFRHSRGRIQPGVLRAIETLPEDARVLDLGCAHGVLAATLLEAEFGGYYVGLDSSQPLLDSVPEVLRPPGYQFGWVDLADSDWVETARSMLALSDPMDTARFDWVFSFAVLHHLPSKQLRQATAKSMRSVLNPTGRVFVSVWDFMASPRLQARVIPWGMVGLNSAQVEPEDYLLDWREGGSGIRYVHHFTERELGALAHSAGFEIAEQYRSDGEEGRLGLYQVWFPSS